MCKKVEKDKSIRTRMIGMALLPILVLSLLIIFIGMALHCSIAYILRASAMS